MKIFILILSLGLITFTTSTICKVESDCPDSYHCVYDYKNKYSTCQLQYYAGVLYIIPSFIFIIYLTVYIIINCKTKKSTISPQNKTPLFHLPDYTYRDGYLVEHNHPKELLEIEESILYELSKQSFSSKKNFEDYIYAFFYRYSLGTEFFVLSILLSAQIFIVHLIKENWYLTLLAYIATTTTYLFILCLYLKFDKKKSKYFNLIFLIWIGISVAFSVVGFKDILDDRFYFRGGIAIINFAFCITGLIMHCGLDINFSESGDHSTLLVDVIKVTATKHETYRKEISWKIPYPANLN